MIRVFQLAAAVLIASASTMALAGPPTINDKPTVIGQKCVDWALKETEKIHDADKRRAEVHKKAKECLLKNKMDPNARDLTEPHIKKMLK
ncbi:MAG: hypothetical protein AB7N80_03085 [Bdellovibrionales bacterium]